MKIMIGNRLIISETIIISVFLNGNKEAYVKNQRKQIFKILVQINEKNIEAFIHIAEFDKRCKGKNEKIDSSVEITYGLIHRIMEQMEMGHYILKELYEIVNKEETEIIILSKEELEKIITKVIYKYMTVILNEFHIDYNFC